MRPFRALALAGLLAAGLPPAAAGELPLPCAPTRAELDMWGLPAGQASEVTLVSSTRDRVVHPHPEGFTAKLLALTSVSRNVQVDEVLDYDETRVDTCRVRRAYTADLDGIAAALALGVDATPWLVGLAQEREAEVVVTTVSSQRVSINDRALTGFLLLGKQGDPVADALDIDRDVSTERRVSQRVTLETLATAGRRAP